MDASLKELIESDLFRYVAQTDADAYRRALRMPGFRFIQVLRKCAYYKSKPGILAKIAYRYYRLVWSRYRFKYVFDVPVETRIGKGFYLGHFGGVYINPAAVIGENVNIAQGVTIGHVYRGRKSGSPTIGDRVWIGPNAVVVGKITIGNNVLIAPLSYVNFDVPDNAVVAGNPAEIVSHSGAEGYVNNIMGDPDSLYRPAPDEAAESS